MIALVEVQGLRVAYEGPGGRIEALRGIDLAIAAGERVAIIGESGSGKSTLALALANLLPSSASMEGSLEWPGPDHRPRNGADIGFVFQDPAASLDPVMSVGRQVAEVVNVHLGLGRADAMAFAARLFGQVQLSDPEHVLHAYPHQLSGGQKQRVAIAAAIAAGPRLLIADEPTSALDTVVQAEIMSLIRRIAADTGMALLLITHDIALAGTVAERIVVLKDGVVMETGATDALFLRPSADYTRSLIAACLSIDTVPLSAQGAGQL